MSDDDTYEIPLQDQRVFGAGIKRQRVKFVPSSTSTSSVPSSSSKPARSISDLYLGLVLPKETSTVHHENDESIAQSRISLTTTTSFSETGLLLPPTTEDTKICDICNLPLISAETPKVPLSYEAADLPAAEPTSRRHLHEASLAHQLCLKHSHPPSHLDRNRKGLAFLSAYGWDPDSRKGLGADGGGIQFPIKTKPKDDKLGIGVVLPKPGDNRKKEKVNKLDAGKVRKLQEKDKRKGEKLREMFYRSEDVERYLGGN